MFALPNPHRSFTYPDGVIGLFILKKKNWTQQLRLFQVRSIPPSSATVISTIAAIRLQCDSAASGNIFQFSPFFRLLFLSLFFAPPNPPPPPSSQSSPLLLCPSILLFVFRAAQWEGLWMATGATARGRPGDHCDHTVDDVGTGRDGRDSMQTEKYAM